MKFRRLECTIFLTLALLFTYAAIAGVQQNRAAGGLLRLHVVANSDTVRDQQVKLAVRDAVLAFCAPVLEHAQDRDAVCAALRPKLQELADCAQQTLEEAGDYRAVTVRLAQEYYPTRNYTDFSLPAGEYLGLRVTIGAGQGHNWWCVIYPALCTEAAAGEAMCPEDAGLTPRYTLRFKTTELAAALRHRLFS